MAVNKMFKLIDSETLIADFALNKITDRDNTDELVSLKHREMGLIGPHGVVRGEC